MTPVDRQNLPAEIERLSSELAALEREVELVSAQYENSIQRCGFFVRTSKHPVGDGCAFVALIVFASVLVIWIARPSPPALIAIGVISTLLLALAVRQIFRGIRYFWATQRQSGKMIPLATRIILLQRQRKKLISQQSAQPKQQ